MNKVQRRASLHEKAVQAIASGEVGPVSTRPRRSPQKRSGDITHIRVLPAVWTRAKEILSTDAYSKIEVIDEATVIVR